MRALTFHDLHDVRLAEVPEPRLEQPTDALVRVHLAGICGSDLHVWHGRERGLDRGTVLGHELVGEVVAAGAAVRRFTAGMRVACPFTTSCGACFYCARELTCRCPQGSLFGWVQHGRGLHGAQAELVRVPLADATLVPLPPAAELPDEAALLLGDVLPTGFYAAARGEVGPGTAVAVVGCGPVGLAATIAARAAGASPLYACDTVPERLALARRFGAEPIDVREQDPVAAVHRRCEGRGADAVLEAVGSAAAVRLAWQLVRPGGTIASAGVHTDAQLAVSPVELYDKNSTFRAGRCPARAFMERLLPFAAAHASELRAIVSHRLPLQEGSGAYELFDRKRDGCTKVVLRP